MAEKVVLAYSGGLDTSVAIRWLGEKYGLEVVALLVDLGAGGKDLAPLREKALRVGAVKAETIEAKESFVQEFVFPALQADILYEGQYPLATALARPLIARLLVDLAHREGATAVAHGCTGKGNDQVRFDVSLTALDPELKIIAPAREWQMTREEEIAYAKQHDIPLPEPSASPYSIDENLWGRSIECGVLEDPWAEPPEEAFTWTRSPEKAPDEPAYLEIGFEKGIPTSLNGEPLRGATLIEKLNSLAGLYGVGRIDHIESRVVGIKSREVYEAPAALLLLQAHQALESLTLSKDQLRFKARVAQEYSELVYNGLWFSQLRQDLDAYVRSSQRFVSGTVRMKLFKGSCSVVGRKSPYSLYDLNLATYEEGDKFDHSASPGFIYIWGLPLRTQTKAQQG